MRKKFTISTKMNNNSSLDAYLSYRATKKQLESNAFGRFGAINDIAATEELSQQESHNKLGVASRENVQSQKVSSVFDSKPTEVKRQEYAIHHSQEERRGDKLLNFSSKKKAEIYHALFNSNKLTTEKNRQILDSMNSQDSEKYRRENLFSKEKQQQQHRCSKTVEIVENSGDRNNFFPREKHINQRQNHSSKLAKEESSVLEQHVNQQQHCQTQKVIKAKDEQIELMTREQKRLTEKVDAYEKRTDAEVLRLTALVQSKDHDLGKLQRLLDTG